MSVPQLSVGTIKVVATTDQQPSPLICQVMQCKKIVGSQPNAQAAQDRYRLIISDGQHFVQAMLASQLNEKVVNNEIKDNCIINIADYICNTVSNKKIIIILNLEVVSGPVPVIGTPQPADSSQSLGQTNTNSNTPLNNKPTPAQNVQTRPNLPQQQRTQPPAKQAQTRPQQNSNQRIQPPSGNFSQNPITPIARLSGYSNRWTIRARVANKSAVKGFKRKESDGRLFNVDFIDESGEIRAVAFDEACDQWSDFFQVDRIYYISKCELKAANKKFSNVRHNYEIFLSKTSDIQECNDLVDIPKTRYEFKNIATLSECSKDASVDILGMAINIEQYVEHKTKKENITYKRNIRLLDQTGVYCDVTLWGEAARTPSLDGGSIPVVALKGAKVGEYQGRKQFSSFNAPDVNPDITEAFALAEWYGSVHSSISPKPLENAASFNGGSSKSSGPVEYKTLSQIKTEGLGMKPEGDSFEARVFISNIRHQSTSSDQKVRLWYNACPTCKKSLGSDDNINIYCEKCKTNVDPQRKYILNFTVRDHTGETRCAAFGDQAETILHETADNIAKFREESDPRFEKTFEDAVNRHYSMVLRAKLDTGNRQNANPSQPEVRCTVDRLEPLNYDKECEKLLGIIASYNINI